MKNNLQNKIQIKQWFIDATYYAIPRKNNSFKLLIIAGFNIVENKTILGAIILIQNENVETFTQIFKTLNIKYNFQPETINVDCNSAEVISIKKIFTNTTIIICYYHIIKKFIQHLPEIRKKDKEIKKKAKNLLNNMKILLFLKRENVLKFYQMISDKYISLFPKFFKYFNNYYLKKYPFKYMDWNYDIHNNLYPINIDHYFFTNNVCESINRTLNKYYKGACKSLLAFENAILKLIQLYTDRNKYEDYNFSYSRAIAYFVSTHEINSLIDNNTMEIVYNDYKKYLSSKKIILKQMDYLSDSDDDYYKNEKCVNTQNDYSSNTEENSSDSILELNELNNEEKNNSRNDSGGDSDQNNNINNTKKIVPNKKKDKKSNNNKNHKNGNNKCKKRKNIYFINNIKIFKEDILPNNVSIYRIDKEKAFSITFRKIERMVKIPDIESENKITYINILNEINDTKLKLRKEFLYNILMNKRFKKFNK